MKARKTVLAVARDNSGGHLRTRRNFKEIAAVQARTWAFMAAISVSLSDHPKAMGPDTLHELEGLDFVFLCMEGKGKKPIVLKLEALNIPFVDVGMGMTINGDKLRGQIRTTTITPKKRKHVHDKNRIAFMTADEVNEYDKNIQVAELNALNAAFAVLKWKKLFGFYDDDGHEHFSVFVVAGAETINEDDEADA